MPVPRSSSQPEPVVSDTESATEPDAPPARSALFAAPKHWLGWQGFTLTLPADWDLAQFGGTQQKGTLRIDDPDGPRIELRWETPPASIDLERSISDFVSRLERDAKKKKQPFQAADHPHIVAKTRKQKAQLVNFGWTGDSQEHLAAHGWGTAWHCADCGRVVVAHLMGRGREKPRAAQQFATDIFTSLECHGRGGWQAWSVFGLSAEIPTEFALGRAKLQTGKIEIEWARPIPRGIQGWQARPERIVLQRLAAANVLLETESLPDWTRRKLLDSNKRTSYGEAEEIALHGEDGLLFRGASRHWRQRAVRWARAKILRQAVPEVELRVWQSERTNKILSLETELTPKNRHVLEDVVDSLDYK